MERLAIERKAFHFFVAAYILSKMWTMLPESEIEHSLFPFNDMMISIRMYFWFLCKFLEMVMVYYGVSLLMIKFRNEVLVIWFLYVLDIPDFALIYGEPLFYIKKYPIEYGMIKGVIMILLLIKIRLKW